MKVFKISLFVLGSIGLSSACSAKMNELFTCPTVDEFEGKYQGDYAWAGQDTINFANMPEYTRLRFTNIVAPKGLRPPRLPFQYYAPAFGAQDQGPGYQLACLYQYVNSKGHEEIKVIARNLPFKNCTWPDQGNTVSCSEPLLIKKLPTTLSKKLKYGKPS